jgi:hypothetical protein
MDQSGITHVTPRTTENVGANAPEFKTLTPDQMASAYQEIDRRHILRQARQQAKSEPNPNSFGAFEGEGKEPVIDPTLS